MSMFAPSEILLPNEGVDLQRWAALACDQFTSQPEYWQEAEDFVGDAPSMLRLMLPEVYLDKPDTEARINQIYEEMAKALQGTLQRTVKGYIYVERTMESGAVRQGLVGCVDLEAYHYEKGAKCGIRPSENTVIERIPPRLAVRRKASIESPHILMLIDDAGETVIEPLAQKKDSLTKVYDLDLMLGGGLLRGWAVEDSADYAAIEKALAALLDEEAFTCKYGACKNGAFCMAVGDGNHSLASAKALWEEIKPTLSSVEQADHPARFCLVELENIQSPAIEVESIHRVIFNEDYASIVEAAKAYATQKGLQVVDGEEEGQTFVVVGGGNRKTITVKNPPHPLPAGTFEDFWASFAKAYPKAEVDYVHGEGAVNELVAQKSATGVLLPDFNKSDLFRGVALGGVLPKKTFSMGHAKEKRYYMECRKIRK